MRKARPRSRSIAAAALAAAVAITQSGCGNQTHSEITVVSAELPVRLAPDLSRRVYVPIDRSAADVYLTDLDSRDLARFIADPTHPTTGTIAHIHLFVNPHAGRTPIDPTAFSATVRYVVLAKGRIGVYDGGGFLLPDDRPGDDAFAGTMNDATLRLAKSTPGFIDRITRGTLDLDFRARRDESEADLIRRAADRAVFRTVRTGERPDADQPAPDQSEPAQRDP